MAKFKNLNLYLVCLIVSTLFLFLYSTSTTPFLNGKWGGDSAFFILVGQGMTKDLLPYRDFFDMKGPYLFFLEFIGQKICYGRTGAFIIQIINLSLFLFFVGKTSDLFISKYNWLYRSISIFVLLSFAIVTFEGGNLTEELCLFPIILCVYLSLAFFKNVEISGTYKHPLSYSLCYGLSVGYITFIRITNVAMIGAVLLVMFVLLVSKKEIRNLIANIFVVAGGFLISTLIPSLYFASKNMLKEMFYQVFIFGFKYSTSDGLLTKLINVLFHFKLYLLLLLVPIFVCVVYRERWYLTTLSVGSALLLFFAISIGNSYLHYFTLLIPHFYLGIVIFFRNSHDIKNQSRNLIALLCIVCLSSWNSIYMLKKAIDGSFTVYSNLNKMYDKHLNFESLSSDVIRAYKGKNYECALDIITSIPDDDKDDIYCFGYESWSWLYGLTGTLPANRYMDWQENYIKLVPEIEDDVASWILKDGSKYIITLNNNKNTSNKIIKAINENYKMKTANEKYTLLIRLDK